MDLSAVGMRIQTLVLLQPQTVVEGALVLGDGRQIALRGEVIWISPPDHRNFVPAEIGLELVDVPDEYLRALAELFAK